MPPALRGARRATAPRDPGPNRCRCARSHQLPLPPLSLAAGGLRCALTRFRQGSSVGAHEGEMITAVKQVSVARPGVWAKLRRTQPRRRGRHAAHMSLHASLHHPARTPADLLQKCPWHAVSTANPGMPLSDLVLSCRFRARTPAARHVLKDERAEADHMGGQRCRLSCVEAGPAARSCGPTHACQGVGRR